MPRASWTECTLGDLITLQRGYDITKKEQRDGPFPVVSSSGLNSTHDAFTDSGPGVVIGRKGTLGTAFYIDGPFWAHDTTLWVRDFKGNDKKFIFYLLKSMNLATYDVGSSNPTLNRNHLHLLPVRTPDVNFQRNISDVLSAYDDLVEVNQRRIAILEEMARRLFDEWFARFRFPGHEAVDMVETELGPVPKGWQIGIVSDIAEVNPETLSPKKAPTKINYIDIASVSVGRVDAVSSMLFSEAPGRARRMVRTGDIIWSTVRPNRRSHALLLDVLDDTVVSTGFAVLRASAQDWAWFYETCRTENFTAFLVGRARGAAYPAVVGNDFLEAPILIPPGEVRAKFQESAGKFHQLAANLGAQNNRLRVARDLLLPKLVSGEIDLSKAEDAFAEAAE